MTNWMGEMVTEDGEEEEKIHTRNSNQHFCRSHALLEKKNKALTWWCFGDTLR